MTQTNAEIDEARRRHRAGDQVHAERLLRRAVVRDPERADAWRMLAMIAHESGRPADAISCLERAVAIAATPGDCVNLGALCHAAGRYADAVAAYDRAVSMDQTAVDAWAQRAASLRRLGRLDQAEASCRRALALAPKHPDAWLNLGNVARERGDPSAAAEAFRRAVAARANSAGAHYNLASALDELGRLDEALDHYRRALAIDPAFADARNDMALLLAARGDAGAAVAEYRRLLEFDPDYADAYNNLAAILVDQDDLPEAIACLRQCVDRCPDHADAHYNLGAALRGQQRLGEAVEALARSLELAPNPRAQLELATVLPTVYESLADLQEWRSGLVQRVDKLAELGLQIDAREHQMPEVFLAAYQGFNDRRLNAAVGRLYRPLAEFSRPLERHERTDGRVRIGFLSRLLHNHTIGMLTQGIIRELDREGFEVHVFSIGQRDDAVAASIRRSADRHHALPDRLIPAIREVAEAELDVLFYPDIGMDSLVQSLAHHRLAPVQCVAWGHPVTTGLPTIDYFVSCDLIEPANADEHYTERLVRLSTLPCCYDRPRLSDSASRSVFGLPDDRRLYACPQSPFKFHPDFDPLLAEILRRDPQGVLVLAGGKRSHAIELLLDRFDRAMPGMSERVCLVPRQSHDRFLQLLAAVDVMLDPLHFGGGNTSYEGLAVGAPIVTLPGEFMRGRLTYACYRRLRVMDLAAASRAEYVELACRAAMDRDFAAHVRQQLNAASEVLYNDRAAVREVEDFFKAAVAAAQPVPPNDAAVPRPLVFCQRKEFG